MRRLEGKMDEDIADISRIVALLCCAVLCSAVQCTAVGYHTTGGNER